MKVNSRPTSFEGIAKLYYSDNMHAQKQGFLTKRFAGVHHRNDYQECRLCAYGRTIVTRWTVLHNDSEQHLLLIHRLSWDNLREVLMHTRVLIAA